AALAPGADPWIGSPGARNIVVAPAASRDAIRARLDRAAELLTCVGVAGAPGERATLLPPSCVARVVPAGTVRAPPLDGYEDPRPPSRSGSESGTTLRTS